MLLFNTLSNTPGETLVQPHSVARKNVLKSLNFESLLWGSMDQTEDLFERESMPLDKKNGQILIGY